MKWQDLPSSDLAPLIFVYLHANDILSSVIYVNKQVRDKVYFYLLKLSPVVAKARLIESSGRLFHGLLAEFRTAALNIGVISISAPAQRLVQQGGSVEALRNSPFVGELGKINASMYTYWASTPGDPFKGVFRYLNDALKSNASTEFNNMRPAMERDCQYWNTTRVFGEFIILCERPDGTIVLSLDCKRVYLVLGIANSLGEVSNLTKTKNSFEKCPPYPAPKLHSKYFGVHVFLTLLNWEDKIVYDGLMMPVSVSDSNERKLAIKAYKRALETNTIIHRLEKKVDPTLYLETPKAGESEVHQVKLEMSAELAQIEAISTNKMHGFEHCLIFRRHRYTEQKNANYGFAIMTGQGACLHPMFPTKGLCPTAQEYIQAIHELVIKLKDKPSEIAIDCLETLILLTGLLKEVHIDCHFYPPPSKEEQLMNDSTNPLTSNFNVPLCEYCGRRDTPDGSSLLRCSKCRRVFYCCREHQKKDWKNHKLDCSD